MKTLCILLGANLGDKPEYLNAAIKLGELIARNNVTLVYGGGRLGLMGVLADTVLKNGGNVVGVITADLYKTEAHLGLTDLRIVNSMQDRKKAMMDMSDGFIALPGGLGTLEEVFEIWNASKLKLHQKPIGLLNTKNYFNKLIEFVDYSVNQKFLKAEHRQLMHMSEDPNTLLNMLDPEIKKEENKENVSGFYGLRIGCGIM